MSAAKKRSTDAFKWLRDVFYVKAVNYSHRKRGPGRGHFVQGERPPNDGVSRQRVLMVPRMGAMPGGLGPTPKGRRNPPPIYNGTKAGVKVPRPWPHAEHAGERARHLRQRNAGALL